MDTDTYALRFFNILADNDVREGLKAFSDWPTFPQLYTNGELVGGLDIVCSFSISTSLVTLSHHSPVCIPVQQVWGLTI